MTDKAKAFASRAALVLAVCLLTQLTINTRAQADAATVHGTISNQQGAVIAGATVTLSGVGKDFTRTQVTDGGGGYVFKVVPAETYTIWVDAAGYERVKVVNVELDANQSVEFNIKMEAGRSDMSKDTPARELLFLNPRTSLLISPWSDISKDAPVRERVEDIKPPIVEARPASLGLCGSRSYLVKDSAGGYLMFTIHTPDMPHLLTIDSPPLSSESRRSVRPSSTFAEARPPGRTERELLIKLLLGWEGTAIPEEKRRMFKHFESLKDGAEIDREWRDFSEADIDLLEMWSAIRHLKKVKK
jgi:hypothetical protein